jgi:hypothetical protein
MLDAGNVPLPPARQWDQAAGQEDAGQEAAGRRVARPEVAAQAAAGVAWRPVIGVLAVAGLAVGMILLLVHVGAWASAGGCGGG